MKSMKGMFTSPVYWRASIIELIIYLISGIVASLFDNQIIYLAIPIMTGILLGYYQDSIFKKANLNYKTRFKWELMSLGTAAISMLIIYLIIMLLK